MYQQTFAIALRKFSKTTNCKKNNKFINPLNAIKLCNLCFQKVKASPETHFLPITYHIAVTSEIQNALFEKVTDMMLLSPKKKNLV